MSSQSRFKNSWLDSEPASDSILTKGYSFSCKLRFSEATISMKFVGNTILLLKLIPILLSFDMLLSLTVGSCILNMAAIPYLIGGSSFNGLSSLLYLLVSKSKTTWAFTSSSISC